MIAGLPGTGIGLIFFVVSALLSPVAELIALARGRSSGKRWRTVGGLVLIATLVVLGIAAMTAVLVFASRAVGADGLSPFWRRISDFLVMVLFGIWAASVMVIFVGLDLIRADRRRSPVRASAAMIMSAALPPAMPHEPMYAEPMYAEPMYAEPMYAEPMQAEPAPAAGAGS